MRCLLRPARDNSCGSARLPEDRFVAGDGGGHGGKDTVEERRVRGGALCHLLRVGPVWWFGGTCWGRPGRGVMVAGAGGRRGREAARGARHIAELDCGPEDTPRAAALEAGEGACRQLAGSATVSQRGTLSLKPSRGCCTGCKHACTDGAGGADSARRRVKRRGWRRRVFPTVRLFSTPGQTPRAARETPRRTACEQS